MKNEAQGAIEYLLIIGAAILVVSLVILALSSSVNSGMDTGKAAQTDQNTQVQKLTCLKDCNALGPCSAGTTMGCGRFTDICTISGNICLRK